MDERAAALLAEVVEEWVADPDSDVVYAEKVEGRLAVRMRQQVREATTVWFWVGDLSLIAEAYVIPAPARRRGWPTGRRWSETVGASG